MKTLINKLFASVTLIVAAASVSLAQTKTIERDFTQFDAVSVSDDFKVNVEYDNSYSAKLSFDTALQPYVECYVKNGCLFIGLDEKKIPKEVKQKFKGKNSSDPVLRAVVYMPQLNSIELSDASTFTCKETIEAEDFNITMNGTAALQNIEVSAKTAKVSMDKKATLSITVEAPDVTVNCDGNSALVIECESTENLSINNSGSAEVTATGDVENAAITCSNFSKMALNGSADKMNISGKGTSAKIDASNFTVKEAVISATGPDIIVDVKNELELDLGKGTEVEYSNDPTIKIVKIESATVIRK